MRTEHVRVPVRLIVIIIIISPSSHKTRSYKGAWCQVLLQQDSDDATAKTAGKGVEDRSVYR
jgi:hypothetical protein